MKTLIKFNPGSSTDVDVPKEYYELLKGVKPEFHLSIPRITLSAGAIFDYKSKKYQSYLAFTITQVRSDPFEDILTYWVDFNDTDLTPEEFRDELLSVWVEPVR